MRCGRHAGVAIGEVMVTSPEALRWHVRPAESAAPTGLMEACLSAARFAAAGETPGGQSSLATIDFELGRSLRVTSSITETHQLFCC